MGHCSNLFSVVNRVDLLARLAAAHGRRLAIGGAMKHIRGIFSLCCIAALLAACATTLPVQEVRQVSAAYNAAAGAAAPLLDELAIAERRAELRAPPEEARAF